MTTNLQTYYFFKKAQRIYLVRQLIYALKDSYLNVKNTKQRYLKKYIYFCATKIQTLYRGHRARKVIVPIRRKLGENRELLLAVAMGWKIRRIMNTKEIFLRIQEIKDYERTEESTLEERKRGDPNEREHLVRMIANLRHSRKVAIEKLINIIEKMSQKALWLTYQKTEQVSDLMTTPRGSNYNSTKGVKHIFLKRKSNPLA